MLGSGLVITRRAGTKDGTLEVQFREKVPKVEILEHSSVLIAQRMKAGQA